MAAQTSYVKPDEKHYTPDELAKLWAVHPQTIRRMFCNEQGVMKIGNQKSTRYKRAHTTLRIPASVVERVHRRLQA